MDTPGAAGLAQDVPIQRVAALTLALRGQQQPTLLTLVTANVETSIQSNDSHRLLLTRFRHDGPTTHGAAGGKFPVEILNAVDLAGGIHCERDAIEAPVTHHTGEATRVVSLPHRPQDSVQDGLRACGTLLQSGHVAALTIRPPLHGVEALAPELGPAGRAHKTANMEDAVQGHNPRSIANHVLPAAATPTEVLPAGRVAHVMHQFLGQPLQLLFRRLT